MVNKILYDIRTYEEDALKTRNRLIEAVWRVIVGNDTVEPEDGELIKQPYVQTEHGPGHIQFYIQREVGSGTDGSAEGSRRVFIFSSIRPGNDRGSNGAG